MSGASDRQNMTQALQRAVRDYVDAHGDASGIAATPLRGVGMMRVYEPTGIMKSIYKPLVCLILQGAKQVTAGAETYTFAARQSALVSADVPIVSRVTRASRTEPYLALAIELDMTVLLDLSMQLGGSTDAVTAVPAVLVPAVLVDDTDAAVADCALRLMRLLDRADAIAVLHPAITRELHYWLLAGRHGRAVRGLACPGGAAQRIARAVAVLRGEFDRPLRVERLAAAAGMSPSSFHHHFRAVTSLSPIQFQKQLRLIEARRRMLGDGLPASRAALEVGYGSVTQFTREYGRMFGLPPGRDISESRAA
jgi:AraC-like DNA-binding protein